MNSTAETASRKWPCSGLGRRVAAMLAAAGMVFWLNVSVEAAAAPMRGDRSGGQRAWSDLFAAGKPKLRRGTSASVPLPKPRPAEAPEVSADKPAANKPEAEKQANAPADRPAEPASPPPSACRIALSEAIAVAPSIPDIHGEGGCGGEDLVRLEAVVLPDKRQVALKPAATLRCTMASAIADWIRTDMTPLATGLGSVITELDNFDSFECRGRNRIVGAKLSEHGRANALDVRSLKLANGQSISLTDRTVPRELRENILHSVCARFSTVLGPGSDGYHEDHVHLDLMERRNNYKICQWQVWDPLPPVAPLLPAERPPEAPPRPTEPATAQTGTAPSGAAKPASTEPGDQAKPEGAEPAVTTKPATKKRR